MKKIVVRVITYNQENLIGRALDSVLQQKEWGLYRIVVSDDSSTDHTWDVLQDYQKKYPDIVDIHRNEHNLGILGNAAKLRTYLPDYDLICGLAGDDAYCDGYFKSVQQLIEAEKIDTAEDVGIFSDFKTVDNEGKEKVFKQDAVLTGHGLMSLKIRGKITSRSLMVTKKVFDSYEPMLLGRGLNLMENHYDLQPHLIIKKVYYLPQITTLYYSGVGVSTVLMRDKSDYRTVQRIEKWGYLLSHYEFDTKDTYYAKYWILRSEFYIQPSCIKLFKIIYYNERSQLQGCRDSFKEKGYDYLSLVKYLLNN